MDSPSKQAMEAAWAHLQPGHPLAEIQARQARPYYRMALREIESLAATLDAFHSASLSPTTLIACPSCGAGTRSRYLREGHCVECIPALLKAMPAPEAVEPVACGCGGPWPVREVLTRLADAADHLLLEHDCDAHGHEGVAAARDSARAALKGRAISARTPSAEWLPVACTTGLHPKYSVHSTQFCDDPHDSMGPMPYILLTEGIALEEAQRIANELNRCGVNPRALVAPENLVPKVAP